MKNLTPVSVSWPTQKDCDKEGRIWVYRPPSMTKWDRTGQMFKIRIKDYIEPLDLQIKHFIHAYSKRKLTKLEYTESSMRAHNNRVSWPYWMPGHVLIEPDLDTIERPKPVISADYPVFTGWLTEKEYKERINKNM
jgi:hypothetical protein